MTPAVKPGLVRLDGSPARSETRSKLRTIDEILARPQRSMVVEGFFGEGDLVVLGGAPKSGKSFVALSLALAMAGETHQWLGMEVDAGYVVYAALEGIAGLSARLRVLGGEAAAPRERLSFWEDRLSVSDGASADEFVDALHESPTPPILVVIDTLARSISGLDENASRDMGVIIDFCDRIRRETGASVLLVHHTGKDRQKGLRGHSSLEAAADVVAIVERSSRDVRMLKLVKSKDGAEGCVVRFQLVPTTVLARGSEVTSCQVKLVAAVGQDTRCEHGHHGSNVKIAYGAICEALSVASGAKDSLSFEEWRDIALPLLPQKLTKQKNQAFVRATKSLLDKFDVERTAGDRFQLPSQPRQPL